MHIAVDLDDVTVDFVGGMLDSYALEFGERFNMGSEGTWGPLMVEFMANGTPLMRAAGYKSAWDWLKRREWLWAQFPAMPGAIGGIDVLRASGHYVEAVTSKPEWAQHNVWKWLGKWRPAFHQVTITDPTQRKVDMTDAALIVDDKQKTCEEFVRAGRMAVLFDPHYAFRKPRPIGVLVAHNWADVLDAVRSVTP